MRALALGLLVVVACGGKIDDGGDSGTVDSGGSDAHADSSPPPPPPPSCKQPGSPCKAPSDCCTHVCDVTNVCALPGPPPPPCKPDGVGCANASECCSNSCNAGMCGVTVSCASTSTKACDQCIAQSCCSPFLNCGSDTTCSTWLGCVQNCEQQAHSAFACTQSTCGMPSSPLEQQLYACAQQHCSTQCTTD